MKVEIVVKVVVVSVRVRVRVGVSVSVDVNLNVNVRVSEGECEHERERHEICTPRFTKRCTCHEICTPGFTKCCACHEICTSRFKSPSVTTLFGGNRKKKHANAPPQPADPSLEEGHVTGWDDPRLLTIRGIRRRGVRPQGIKRMADGAAGQIGGTWCHSVWRGRRVESAWCHVVGCDLPQSCVFSRCRIFCMFSGMCNV